MHYGNFTNYADAAMDRGDLHTAKRIKVEGRVCAALIDALLAKGALISVNNGEEWNVKTSTDKATIIGGLFETDMDTLLARDADGNKLGWWSLIYGNDGYDVISDYSANDFAESIWNEIKPVIDRAEYDMC